MGDEREDVVIVTATQYTTGGQLLSRLTWETFYDDVTQANVFNTEATKNLVAFAEELGRMKADDPNLPGQPWDDVVYTGEKKGPDRQVR